MPETQNAVRHPRRETSMEIDMPTKGLVLAETRGSRLFFASLLEASLATAKSRYVSCEQQLLAAVTASDGADAVEADEDSVQAAVQQSPDHDFQLDRKRLRDRRGGPAAQGGFLGKVGISFA